MDPDRIDPQSPDGARHDGAAGDVAAALMVARKALETARSALDRAVAALPDVDGDEAMATPTLMLLLFGAVRAKEQLSRLELVQARPLAEA